MRPTSRSFSAYPPHPRESSEEVFELAIASAGCLIEMVKVIEADASKPSFNWCNCFADIYLDFARILYLVTSTPWPLREHCGDREGKGVGVVLCGVQAPNVLSAVLRLIVRHEEALTRALRRASTYDALMRGLGKHDRTSIRLAIEGWGPEVARESLRPIVTNLWVSDLQQAIRNIRDEYTQLIIREWTRDPLREWGRGHRTAVRCLLLAKRFRETWERYVTSARYELFRAAFPGFLRSAWAYARWGEGPARGFLQAGRLTLHQRIGRLAGNMRYEFFDDDAEYFANVAGFCDVPPRHPWFTLQDLIQDTDDANLGDTADCVADEIYEVCVTPAQPLHRQLTLAGMEEFSGTWRHSRPLTDAIWGRLRRRLRDEDRKAREWIARQLAKVQSDNPDMGTRADIIATVKDSPTGMAISALDQACLTALGYFKKPGGALLEGDLRKPTKKFQLVCCYWHRAENLSPAKIRDRFRERFPSCGYSLPDDEAGRDRVKKAIKAGDAFLRSI